jgi:serine/threonine protein kinase/tetratricopeptide (TPR) repeat protein
MTLIGQRYQIIDAIGSGGMGTVYRALDRLTLSQVALKQVNPPERRQALLDVTTSSALRLALAGEFRMMASLHHPNIISVLDYGFDSRVSTTGAVERHPYYTMDLLDGAQTLIAAGQNQPLEQQIDLIMQLLQALSYLHRRKIVHRDLKPSNILVFNDRVKVLDFGLSIISGERDETAGMTVGTLAYLAPEVLVGEEASAVSDLYAVGVLAYELLTGKHPFSIHDPNRMLIQIMNDYPDMMLLPDHLSFVVLTLMAKDKSDRFRSAEAAIQGFCDAANLPLPRETIEIRESFLQTAPLIGRDREFDLLLDALKTMMDGHGSAWLIGGESGVGKSRLLDEIAVQGMVNGALVLRGQGVEEGAAPYQHWRSPIRWLSLLLDLTETEIAVLQLIVPDIEALLENHAPASQSDPKTQRERLLRLLPSLFRRASQSIVLILEDIHWGSSDSLDLLRQLVPVTGDIPLLILASYRDDETSSLADALPDTMEHLKLDRLSDEEVASLSAAILGESGRRESVVQLLQQETEGNVFFLLEVIRALADDAGQLDQIGVVTLPSHILAGGIQQVIQRRLDRVPEAARALLQLAAAAGRRLDLPLLRALDKRDDLSEWLATCANAAVLETYDGTWRFTHDKMRDAILAALSISQRADLHRQIARGLENQAANPVSLAPALAYHWGAAGDKGKCLHFTLISADSMLRGGGFQDALAALERTRTLATELGSPETVFAQIRDHETEAHLGLGQYDPARALLEQNAAVYTTNGDTAGLNRVFQRLGDIYYTLEDLDQAQTAYQRALEFAQSIPDSARIAQALNSLGNVAFDLDEVNTATQLYQASLSISRAEGGRWGIAGSIAQDSETDDID